MITYAIVFVVGFVAGALVFRNNAAKGEKLVEAGESAVAKGKKVADSFRK